jgi:hypothetical protein
MTRLGCHPERSEGSPLLNRGVEQTLLELHPKTKTEEMSHFVRHDTIKSLFGEIRRRSFASFRTTKIRTVGKGVTFPLCVTPSCLCEGSPPLNGGGLCPPPTPPKTNLCLSGVSSKGETDPFRLNGRFLGLKPSVRPNKEVLLGEKGGDPLLRSGRQEKGGDPSQKAFGTTLCVGWEGDTPFQYISLIIW